MNQEIQHQLSVIDRLLKSVDFSLSIAKSQESAYYTGVGAPVPEFMPSGGESAIVNKSLREEKMAISLAGFYALECGLGALCIQTHEKPGTWLTRIANDQADVPSILLLTRFANATWKISQPFRSLDRITRSNFTGACFLPAAELKKDYVQVKNAASKLLTDIQDVIGENLDIQMRKIRALLNNQQYAWEMAEYLNTVYYTSNGKTAPPFLAAGEDRATTPKSARDQKIAINLAGFYALESCMNYLVSTRHILPATLLTSIINNSIAPADKNLFSRFANATWKTNPCY